jgi:hypothetical protein
VTVFLVVALALETYRLGRTVSREVIVCTEVLEGAPIQMALLEQEAPAYLEEMEVLGNL